MCQSSEVLDRQKIVGQNNWSILLFGSSRSKVCRSKLKNIGYCYVKAKQGSDSTMCELFKNNAAELAEGSKYVCKPQNSFAIKRSQHTHRSYLRGDRVSDAEIKRRKTANLAPHRHVFLLKLRSIVDRFRSDSRLTTNQILFYLFSFQSSMDFCP